MKYKSRIKYLRDDNSGYLTTAREYLATDRMVKGFIDPLMMKGNIHFSDNKEIVEEYESKTVRELQIMIKEGMKKRGVEFFDEIRRRKDKEEV